VSSEAYGRREEWLGIHLACAAAADAYASARLAGHPVIALLVGKAMSGAFLAHGYQANRIIALDSPEVMVQAMGKQAAARVTRSSVEEMEKLGERIAPVAYDIRSYASLGLLHKLIDEVDADAPGRIDLDRVRAELVYAVADARAGAADLACRLTSPAARKTRAASIEVRRRLAEQWRSAEQGRAGEPGDVRSERAVRAFAVSSEQCGRARVGNGLAGVGSGELAACALRGDAAAAGANFTLTRRRARRYALAARSRLGIGRRGAGMHHTADAGGTTGLAAAPGFRHHARRRRARGSGRHL